MTAHIQVYKASVIIKPEGKRKRTIMLPRPLAAKLAELLAPDQHDELLALSVEIFYGSVKSSIGLYYYPPETNPDIPEAELSN